MSPSSVDMGDFIGERLCCVGVEYDLIFKVYFRGFSCQVRLESDKWKLYVQKGIYHLFIIMLYKWKGPSLFICLKKKVRKEKGDGARYIFKIYILSL